MGSSRHRFCRPALQTRLGTLEARTYGLPSGMIVIYAVGNGTQLVLDYRKDGTNPPVLRVLGLSCDASEQKYGGFADFLLDTVRQELDSA